MSDIATRATANRPCRVCESGTKGCSVTADGLHLCRGEPADPAAWKRVKRTDTGYDCYRPAGDPSPARRPAPRPSTTEPARPDFGALAREHAARMTPAHRSALCRRLGLPGDALAVLPLAGVCAEPAAGPVFTFPECDGSGAVIGIGTRATAADGPDRKLCLKGSRRGLTLPAGWRDRPGPVFLVEGPTDAVALTAAGLAAVGRPSNSGGADHLAGLLRGWPADRGVVVVAEHDAKPDGSHPGRAGAEGLAAKLSAALGRPVLVAYPPAGAKDVRGWLTAPARGDAPWADRGAELLAHLTATAAAPPARATPVEADGGGEAGPAAADRVLAVGRQFDLFHDPAGTAYATDGRRTLEVGSVEFGRRLTARYFADTGRPCPPAAMKQAVATLDALAAAGPERPVHLRFASHGDRSYLHLADPDDTVIEVDADGWRACADPPVRFVRRAGMGPLPVPARGGDLRHLRRFVNLPGDDAFALVLAWLVAAVRGVRPYPVLILNGESASGKTTVANFIKALIDPGVEIDAEPGTPATVRDLVVTALHAAVPSFGNLSGLSGEMSDALARLATGMAQSERLLHTNTDQSLTVVCRPAILNGIPTFVTAGDLASRGVSVRLRPIPDGDRRDLTALTAAFLAARPALLGALLDRVAAGLRALPGVELAELPRMAGFARFAVACERGAGDPERVLAAYSAAYADARARTLDNKPAVGALVGWFAGRERWAGTATELLHELGRATPVPHPKGWPGAAHVLTAQLNRAAPDLRAVHRIDISCGSKDGSEGGSRRVVVTRLPPPVPPAAQPKGDAWEGDLQ